MLLSRINEFMLTIPQLPILLIISAILLKRDVVLPLPGFVNKFLSALMLAPGARGAEGGRAGPDPGDLRLAGRVPPDARHGAVAGASRTSSRRCGPPGASDARIIFRHIIPNGLAPILVNASLALGAVIVLESALSFLGLGVQDPTPTWGNMLDFARSYMFQHPWLPLVPGIPLVIVSMGFNFIGDGLRDALDPRLKR